MVGSSVSVRAARGGRPVSGGPATLATDCRRAEVMAFKVFRRLSTLGKRATDMSQDVRESVGGTLGIRAGLPSPIGLDFGAGSLKLLQIQPGEPVQLLAAACLETPANLLSDNLKRLEYQFQALPKLVKQSGFKGKRAMCALPAWTTICKHIQFARTDGMPLPALINGAIASQLNADPENFVARHIEVGNGSQTGGKTEVILIATPREIINRLMRAMLDAKLEPVGMHSEFDANLNAITSLMKRSEDQHKTTLIVDLGTSATRVMIAHGWTAVFARVIELGGRHLDETIARQLSCSVSEARKQRLALDRALTTPVTPIAVSRARVAEEVEKPAAAAATVGNPIGFAPPAVREERRGGTAVQPGLSMEIGQQETVAVAPEGTDVHEPLEILTDELQMSLRYHAAQFPGRRLDRLIFLGGESRHRGLCQHIARTLRLPSHMADPLVCMARTGDEPSVGVDFRLAQPGWTAAIGLCMSRSDL